MIDFRAFLSLSILLPVVSGCMAPLGGVLLAPPTDGHELAARIATVVHSGRSETRPEIYNYFGIDPRNPNGRILSSAEAPLGSNARDWAVSYSVREFSKSLNVIVWKLPAWCVKQEELESLLKFPFDKPDREPVKGFGHTVRRDGSTQKANATFTLDGCMTAFYAAVQ